MATPANGKERALGAAVSTFVSLLIFLLTAAVIDVVERVVSPDPEASEAARRQALWISVAGVAIAYVVAWLAVSQGGRRMAGDAVMSLLCVEDSGAPAPRWRVLIRAGLPLALMFIGDVAWQGPAALPLVLVLWAPAVWGSRRSVFDRAAGVWIVSYKHPRPSATGFRWQSAGTGESDPRDLMP